jgi:hypothetical protein
MLVGTWVAADGAIRFLYLRHGFELVAPERKTGLFKTYLDHPRSGETA